MITTTAQRNEQCGTCGYPFDTHDQVIEYKGAVYCDCRDCIPGRIKGLTVVEEVRLCYLLYLDSAEWYRVRHTLPKLSTQHIAENERLVEKLGGDRGRYLQFVKEKR